MAKRSAGIRPGNSSSPNTTCPKIYGERDDGGTSKTEGPVEYENRETATYRVHEAAKLLNLYKSNPSPGNNSTEKESGGQLSAIDNY